MKELTEIQKEWVRRLREPGRKQCRNRLGYGGARCCLGVLCDYAVEVGVIGKFCKSDPVPPGKVIQWSGLRTSEGDYKDISLACDNDFLGKTFPEIADIIEQNDDTLFV